MSCAADFSEAEHIPPSQLICMLGNFDLASKSFVCILGTLLRLWASYLGFTFVGNDLGCYSRVEISRNQIYPSYSCSANISAPAHGANVH